MKKLAVFLLTGLTCASMLFGCGSKNDTVETVPVAEVQESTAAPAETESETETATVEEDVPPEEGMVKSDLTGEWISGDLADQRPIAVMIPDENAALPHYGLSNADILYECSVEGNMTRLMAVFKDWKNIERIGNIRSCRDYYVYWAKEWDAIYCHIGGPFYILNAINDPTTNNITGAVLASDPSQKKGLYDAAFYRTSDRKAPHNAYTSGDRIDKANRPVADTAADHFQRRQHPVDGGVQFIKSGIGMRQILFQHQGDFGFHLRLQHPGERHIGVIAVAHVGKQGAEVRLVNAQLLLHFRMGQSHLASHHPAAVRHVVLHVHPLDSIGRFGIVDAEERSQRFNRLAATFRLTQPLRQVFKR